MSLKRKASPPKKSIRGFKRSAEGFARKLSLKGRSKLSMLTTKRYLDRNGGPAYRRKFRRTYRG